MIICSLESEETSHVVSKLLQFKRDYTIFQKDRELAEYLEDHFKNDDDDDDVTSAATTDPEKLGHVIYICVLLTILTVIIIGLVTELHVISTVLIKFWSLKELANLVNRMSFVNFLPADYFFVISFSYTSQLIHQYFSHHWFGLAHLPILFLTIIFPSTVLLTSLVPVCMKYTA